MTHDRGKPDPADTAIHSFDEATGAPNVTQLRVATAEPQLHCGDSRFTIREGTIVIGRGEGCDIVVDAAGVSRRHARITFAGDEIRIEDLGSKNGTFIGTEAIDGIRRIHHSCPIRLGPVWLVLYVPETGKGVHG